MLSSDAKRKCGAGLMFVLPLCLLVVVRLVLSPAQQVQAAIAPAPVIGGGPAAGPIDPLAKLDEHQRAAVTHIVQLREEPFGSSPFYYAPTGSLTMVVENGDPATPQFAVQMILTSSTGNIALINGEKYMIGDALADTGWVISEIDAKDRSVVIEDPETGRTAVRTVPVK